MKRGLFLFLLGTAVFAACWQFTPLGFILSSIAGIGVLALARAVIAFIDRQRKKADYKPEQKAVDDVVSEGMEKIRQMSNKTRMIKSNAVAAKVRDICKVGVRIFDDIKKNPDDMRRARQFINYYLDTTNKIINQYVELSSKQDLTPEVSETMEKIEGMLDSIKSTFDKQLANLLENDLLDINTEIKVLEKTMKMEG